MQLLEEMQAGVGDDKLIVAKDGGGFYNDTKYVNTLFMSDCYCSCYRCTAWTETDASTCVGQISAAIEAGKRGQVVFMHGEANQADKPAAPEQQTFTFALAAYLVAAQENSFFGYSNGWYYNGSKWWAEYDRPLGAPLEEAVLVGRSVHEGVYTRRFEHATVHLDVAGYNASIDWAAAPSRAN